MENCLLLFYYYCSYLFSILFIIIFKSLQKCDSTSITVYHRAWLTLLWIFPILFDAYKDKRGRYWSVNPISSSDSLVGRAATWQLKSRFSLFAQYFFRSKDRNELSSWKVTPSLYHENPFKKVKKWYHLIGFEEINLTIYDFIASCSLSLAQNVVGSH